MQGCWLHTQANLYDFKTVSVSGVAVNYSCVAVVSINGLAASKEYVSPKKSQKTVLYDGTGSFAKFCCGLLLTTALR